MARKAQKLTVAITPRALRDLDEIWEWNAEQNGIDSAEVYVSFLRAEVYRLDQRHIEARQSPRIPEIRYITVRKGRPKHSHGHIVVFQVVDQAVEVLRIYHTSQDWENRFLDSR